MIHYLVTAKHHYTVSDYLGQSWGAAFRDRLGVVPYARLRGLPDLPRGCYIFSDVDRLSPPQKQFAVRLWNRLRESGRGTRLLNDPARVPGRLDLLQHLHATGMNRFRALRANEEAELRYPVFLRENVEHSGNLTGLIRNAAELARAKKAQRDRGFRLEDLLVVEFCDTSGDTGLFRKYSAFTVGGVIIPRYLTVSADWMVKYRSMIVNDATVAEELEFMRQNPHRTWLAELFRSMHVDYGRIDYGMLDGKPQVWEINLNPAIGAPRRRTPPSEERRRQVAMRLPFTTLFYERFAQALDQLDS